MWRFNTCHKCNSCFNVQFSIEVRWDTLELFVLEEKMHLSHEKSQPIQYFWILHVLTMKVWKAKKELMSNSMDEESELLLSKQIARKQKYMIEFSLLHLK